MATDRWRQFVRIFAKDEEDGINKPISSFKSNGVISLNVKEDQSESDFNNKVLIDILSELKVMNFQFHLITNQQIDKDDIGV